MANSDDEPASSFTLVSEEALYHCSLGKAESKIFKSLNRAVPKSMRPEHRASYYINTTLDMEDYRHARRVYENNQEYYLQNPAKYERKLRKLEEWFIRVREPKPVKRKGRLRAADQREYNEIVAEWKKREMTKWQGHSYYCLPEAKKLIIIDRDILREVKAYLREEFQSSSRATSSTR